MSAHRTGTPEGMIGGWLTTDEVFAPLPPAPVFIEGLDIGIGRATAFSGLASSGKTAAMQSMFLSLAAGIPVFGHFRVPKVLRVGHVDADQGSYATRRRYERFRVGMGLTVDDLGGRLHLTSMPPWSFIKQHAEDQLVRTIEVLKLDLIGFDAYRRLIPGLDENDSRAAIGFEICTRASERTNIPLLMLIHSGKGGDSEVTAAVRGSSALIDSAGAVYHFDGKPGKAKDVTHVRPSATWEGDPSPPFRIEIEGAKGGPLMVTRLDPKVQAERNAAANRAKADAGQKSERKRLIRIFLRDNPNASQRSIEEHIKGRAQTVREALDEMRMAGEVMRTGSSKGYRFTIVPFGQRVKLESKTGVGT